MNDGGPAFPAEHANSGETRNGMTLRDWLAGHALSAMLLRRCDSPKAASRIAYEYADAMLAEREKGGAE